MKITSVKLSDLHLPEVNVRLHPEKQLHEFERSVKMFGQTRPIVTDENGLILAGCGLYETLSRMGREEADCYQIPGLTENQKKKLMLADNKIQSLGVDYMDGLDRILATMEGDFDIPGYDGEVLAELAADAEEVTEAISSYGVLDTDAVESVRAAGERVERRMEEAGEHQETAGTQETAQEPYISPYGRGNDSDEESTAETGRYVICPKCGARIWL